MKPRIAENEKDFWKNIVDLCENGFLDHSSCRILYPVIRIAGYEILGDFRILKDKIEKIEFHGVGTCKLATNSEISEIEYAIKTDTCMVILQSHWGYSGNPKTGKPIDLEILHSPSGNSWK